MFSPCAEQMILWCLRIRIFGWIFLNTTFCTILDDFVRSTELILYFVNLGSWCIQKVEDRDLIFVKCYTV